ncbi:hypothetical protein SLEP1_g27380 [Rubroshorea leprosula]|uniref:Elongator complex protein 5 n=1 Tax=Rubroshorea leprosula TaxID=152421 RepID=A0AAV5JQC5_9ROSI|nr:hypothetical protein SLEP1_g27380 [Rubroshorea leprosula]
MAESVCRALRDGGLEGGHAPALTIKDSIASPFGFDVFCHVLSQLSSLILAGKSQSTGLVVVAFRRSPSCYVELLESKGIDIGSSNKWIQILDCYTDPLGWKFRLMDGGNIAELSSESSSTAILCKDVKDVDKLYSSIIEVGKGLITESRCRSSVAIDSVILHLMNFYLLALLLSMSWILGYILFLLGLGIWLRNDDLSLNSLNESCSGDMYGNFSLKTNMCYETPRSSPNVVPMKIMKMAKEK